jgi:hypothetical protein
MSIIRAPIGDNVPSNSSHIPKQYAHSGNFSKPLISAQLLLAIKPTVRGIRMTAAILGKKPSSKRTPKPVSYQGRQYPIK